VTRQHKHAGIDTRPPAGAHLKSIPQKRHLVDAYCPNRHLAAVLAANGDAGLVVLAQSPQQKPTVAYHLSDDGELDPVITQYDRSATGSNVVRVGGIGDPHPTGTLYCQSCRPTSNRYLLVGAEILDAHQNGKTSIGLRRALDA
jgi:hypothetical protein